MRQIFPTLISANFGGGQGGKVATDNEMVCLAPNNTVSGSRVPEGKFPESAANSIIGDGRTMAMSAAVISSVLAIFLY